MSTHLFFIGQIEAPVSGRNKLPPSPQPARPKLWSVRWNGSKLVDFTEKSFLVDWVDWFGKVCDSLLMFTHNNSMFESSDGRPALTGAHCVLRIAGILVLSTIFLSGCVNVTATRTTTVNGVATTETITVKSFLENITDGSYSTTNGMILSTSSATPDQQSIATLAGVVGDLGKSAMLMASKPGTNTVNVLTNSTGNIIVTPTK